MKRGFRSKYLSMRRQKRRTDLRCADLAAENDELRSLMDAALKMLVEAIALPDSDMAREDWLDDVQDLEGRYRYLRADLVNAARAGDVSGAGES